MADVVRDRLVALVTAQDESSSSVQLAAKQSGALRLHVEGVGDIELPVTEGQSARLLALGRRAPFGRGVETLTDTSVRDTWEIPSELVRVEWDGSGLDHDIEAVREDLGLPDHCRLTAQLHSMLVYDTGQFFLPHQDSEKDDAMVATLVVTLPSEHTGGELVVHHLGEATAYRGLPDRLSLVAFYADCRHEVRPVTSGRRITLTYNLLLRGDPVGRVPDEVTIAEVATALREHVSTPVRRPYRDVAGDPPARLVFLLDHEYTARGLGWSRLKGDDAGRATLLRAAADHAGFTAVLALTEIQETWEAAEPDHGHRTSRPYWDGLAVEDDADGQDGDDGYDGYDGDDGDDGDDGYEVDQLLDSSIRLTLWTDDVGTDEAEIALGVDAAEVCAATPSSDLRPYESQYEGYMGNYGNTVDRWYRRAAVVLWPQERDFTNRAEVSPSWAMAELAHLARAADPAVARDAARTLAPFWDAAVRGVGRRGELLTETLPAAVAVDDPPTALMLLRPFPIETLRSSHAALLAELAAHYGEPWVAGDVLRPWSGDRRQAWLPVEGLSRVQWLTSLPLLCEALRSNGGEGESIGSGMVQLAWDGLATLLADALASPSAATRQQLDRFGEPLAALCRAAASVGASDALESMVGFCREHAEAMSACVAEALRTAAGFPAEMRQRDVFVRLASEQEAVLRARLAGPPRAAEDWSIELPRGCRCELCSSLGVFLADPSARVREWPLASGGRSHVHDRISQAELSVTHQTRRQGRPYTLVLTKTADLFEGEARQRVQDQADLTWLDREWTPRPRR
ncbi:MAG: 2OG-Fe(II) oxygenase [Kineosporiaceae bacterium]